MITNEEMDDSHVPLVMAFVVEKQNDPPPTLLTESILMDGSHKPGLDGGDRKDNMLPYTTTAEDFQEQVSRPSTVYRDVFFLVAWAVDCLIVVCIGIFAGISCMHTDGKCMSASMNPHHATAVEDRPTELLGPLTTAFVVAAIMCAVMIVLVQWYSQTFLKCMLWTSIGLPAATGALMLAVQPVVGVILLVMAAGTCCYYAMVRKRLEFAGVMLETACTAIRRYPESVIVAFGPLFVQLIVVVFFALAYYGAEATTIDFGGFLLEFFLLFSLFWTLQIVQNVAHCSTCGVVGSWWFTNNDRTVAGAFKRAATTSLGSICFGSLIVALLRTVRIMVSQFRKASERNGRLGRALGCMMHCVEYVLNIIEHYARYMNSYAYCFVALYGKDFRTSGREVQALFQQRGWTAVINDDLVSTTLVVANFGVAAVSALAGGLASRSSSYARISQVTMPAFVLGLLMAFTVTGVLMSAVRTIFVWYAKASDVIGRTRPESAEKLRKAWEKFHPTSVVVIGSPAASQV